MNGLVLVLLCWCSAALPITAVLDVSRGWVHVGAGCAVRLKARFVCHCWASHLGACCVQRVVLSNANCWF